MHKPPGWTCQFALSFFLMLPVALAASEGGSESLGNLVGAADLIVQGRVLESPRGGREGGSKIYVVVPTSVLKGAAGRSSITVFEPLSAAGPQGRMLDLPALVQGEEYLFFLRSRKMPGRYELLEGSQPVDPRSRTASGLAVSELVDHIRSLVPPGQSGGAGEEGVTVGLATGDLRQMPEAGTGHGEEEEVKASGSRAPDRKGLGRVAGAATQIILNEGFEGVFPSGLWSTFDNNGSTGGTIYWNDTSYRSYAGSWSGWCAGGGTNSIPGGSSYVNYMDSWATYGPFSLSDAIGGSLSFRYWLQSELNYDFLKYMVSINGTNYYGYQVSGNSGGWQSASIDLTSVPGLGNVTGDASVWIAFTFASDSSNTGLGAYIDEVRVEKTTAGAADLDLQWVDVSPGTYTPGGPITIHNITQNIGGQTSPAYRITFYASTNTTISSSDYAIGYIDRSALSAGATHNFNTSGTLPGNLPAGTYYIGAILTVTDASSSNNINYDPDPITAGGSPEISIDPLQLVFSSGNAEGEARMSADGEAARASGLDHLLHLKTGEVDLARSGQTAESFESTPAKAGGRRHLVLQFNGLPSPEERASLAAAGIRLLQYLPNHAYWAVLDEQAKSLTAVTEGGGLRWTWEPPALYKMSPEARLGVYPPNARLEDGMVRVYARVFEDVPLDRARSEIAGLAGATVAGAVLEQVLAVDLRPDRVEALASLDVVEWVEPAEPPDKLHNATSAARIQADDLWAAPYSWSGAGVVVGIWDGGSAAAHSDFGGRLTLHDAGASISNHATHVTGTVGGSGAGNGSARGMANQAALHSWDFSSDEAEMRNEGPGAGIEISNHSYGTVAGWDSNGSSWTDYGSGYFGTYSTSAAEWDDIIVDTGLIAFKSAGNDRNDGPDWPTGPRMDGPFDTIPTYGNAKNIVTVCATTDTDAMSQFSSWGPSDDGRVKPDLCANGTGLTSTLPGNTYGSYDGTSMSSPSAAGAAALLHQGFVAQNGSPPNAATLKALMIHGCRDLGRTGPDYEFGWGLIDAKVSADLVRNSAWRTGTIGSTGQEQTFAAVVPAGATSFKATLVWTDPAGSPAAASALVNNLNLSVTAPDGTVWSPWVLNPASVTSPATRGTNNRDNVEQVSVPNPAAGTWTIRVLGGAVPSGPQAFSLVAEGLSGGGGGSQSFTIRNQGSSNLSVTAMALDQSGPWIQWSPAAPFNIAPGGSQQVNVAVNFASAPAGQSTRRIQVSSNDADENPYPGGVDIVVQKQQQSCYTLTRTHTGQGADPSASPGSSTGCPSGQYHAGEQIQLTASPASGWMVAGWSGTGNNGGGSIFNSVSMPARPHTVSVQYQAIPTTTELDFYTVTPCRVFDTRSTTPLVSGVNRYLPVSLSCGIPADAMAVSANITVVLPTGLGHITLYPWGASVPLASTINFRAGQVRANNAILKLSANGELGAFPVIAGGGQVHLILDVSGYFR